MKANDHVLKANHVKSMFKSWNVCNVLRQKQLSVCYIPYMVMLWKLHEISRQLHYLDVTIHAGCNELVKQMNYNVIPPSFLPIFENGEERLSYVISWFLPRNNMLITSSMYSLCNWKCKIHDILNVMHINQCNDADYTDW